MVGFGENFMLAESWCWWLAAGDLWLVAEDAVYIYLAFCAYVDLAVGYRWDVEAQA